MSGAVKTTIIGLGELQSQFKRIAKAARGEMLAKAGTAGLQLVVNAAKPKAPKLTGELRRSLHTQVAVQRDDYAEVEAGTDMIYGPIQEFGGVIKRTSSRGKKYTTTIKPHPYLRPAWDEKIDAVITEVKASLVDLITKAAAK